MVFTDDRVRGRETRQTLKLFNELKGEFQVEMPSESQREKGFLDGMEQSCWAADLMDHRQKRGNKQEDCIVTETQIEVKQLKAFLDLVPGSAISKWFPLNRRKRR